MRIRGSRGVVGSALCALIAALAAPALAEAPRPAGESRWVPSLGIYSGVTIQKWRGAHESLCSRGGPGNASQGRQSCNFWVLPNQPGPLRPPDQESNDLSVAPFLGFNLQLMAPAITAVPGRPRFYVFGESQLTFGTEREVASEGDPTGVALPGTVSAPEDTSALALVGTGSKTAARYQRAGWGAGLGIAFPVRFLGRQFYIKPNAAWMRYKVAIDGKVVGGIKDDFSTPPPGPGGGAQFGSNVRDVTLKSSAEEYYNGIGGGLEVAMDAVHWGPLGVSLFMGGNAYKILGERETRLSASSSFDNSDGIPASDYSANWRYEVDPWIYRVTGGIRVSWLGD
jgi:hypothetical protein